MTSMVILKAYQRGGGDGGVEFSFTNGRNVETAGPWHLTISTGRTLTPRTTVVR